MTQEDKDLLIRDLCARLPYGVKVKHKEERKPIVVEQIMFHNQFYVETKFALYVIDNIKPYLFPMSSMTGKQKSEYKRIKEISLDEALEDAQNKLFCIYDSVDVNELYIDYKHIDWLNAHHFDYRGLIEKGLAINANAVELNIY